MTKIETLRGHYRTIMAVGEPNLTRLRLAYMDTLKNCLPGASLPDPLLKLLAAASLVLDRVKDSPELFRDAKEAALIAVEHLGKYFKSLEPTKMPTVDVVAEVEAVAVTPITKIKTPFTLDDPWVGARGYNVHYKSGSKVVSTWTSTPDLCIQTIRKLGISKITKVTGVPLGTSVKVDITDAALASASLAE